MRRIPVRARAVAGAVAAVTALGTAALTGPLAGPGLAAGAPVGGGQLGSARVVLTAGGTPAPKVAAASWLVADATTGTVLGAKDAHGRFFPASTLKTLTALVLLPRLNKATSYLARDSDTRIEGTRVGIVAGSTYTVNQLFYGLFLASGNDAASALANVAGGPAATVRAMNTEAQLLQADDTHVVNPSGLDARGQLTSAYDLALIAVAGLARPDFRAYAGTKVYAFPGVKPPGARGPRPTFQIQNGNRLLLAGYPGMVGVKVGYTTDAGNTYVGAAERGGHLLIVVLMKITGLTEVAERALLNWGFANVGKPGVGVLVPTRSDLPAAAPTTSTVAAGLGVPVASGLSDLPVVLFGGTGGAAVLLLGLVGVGASRRRRSHHERARLAAAARRSAAR